MAALRIAAAFAVLISAAPAPAGPVDRWAAHIDEASSRFGVPADWIARVIRAESGGETILRGQPIVSSAGAMGLMQLMPATWREMRSRLRLGFDPHDPRDNILAGSLYLRLMYDRFGYPGLFAAYNAGPARYAAFLSGKQRLPAETRAYLVKVAGAARRGLPAQLQPAAPLFAWPQARTGPGNGRLAGAGAELFVQLGAAPRP